MRRRCARSGRRRCGADPRDGCALPDFRAHWRPPHTRMRPFPIPCQRPCADRRDVITRTSVLCPRRPRPPTTARTSQRQDGLDEGSRSRSSSQSCPRPLRTGASRPPASPRPACAPPSSCRSAALDPQRVLEQPEHHAERQHHREVEDRQQDARLDVRRLLRDLPPAAPAVAGPALEPALGVPPRDHDEGGNGDDDQDQDDRPDRDWQQMCIGILSGVARLTGSAAVRGGRRRILSVRRLPRQPEAVAPH